MQVEMGKVNSKNTSGAPWPMKLSCKLIMGIHTSWRQHAPVPFHRQGNRGKVGDLGTWMTELWYVILLQVSITQSSACQGVPSRWWQSLVTTGSVWVLRDNETYQPRVLAHMARGEKPFLSSFPSIGRTYTQLCQDPTRAQYKDSPPRGDTAQTKGILEDRESGSTNIVWVPRFRAWLDGLVVG